MRGRAAVEQWQRRSVKMEEMKGRRMRRGEKGAEVSRPPASFVMGLRHNQRGTVWKNGWARRTKDLKLERTYDMLTWVSQKKHWQTGKVKKKSCDLFQFEVFSLYLWRDAGSPEIPFNSGNWFFFCNSPVGSFIYIHCEEIKLVYINIIVGGYCYYYFIP